MFEKKFTVKYLVMGTWNCFTNLDNYEVGTITSVQSRQNNIDKVEIEIMEEEI